MPRKRKNVKEPRSLKPREWEKKKEKERKAAGLHRGADRGLHRGAERQEEAEEGEGEEGEGRQQGPAGEEVQEEEEEEEGLKRLKDCLLYTSPSPRDKRQSRMPSSA